MSTGNQQLLQRYAKPLFVSSATEDANVPFSFKDWYATHQGVIPGQEFKQYNEYLVLWYKDKSKDITDFKLQLRLNYLTLLKQLQLFFTQEEAENWYSKVNLDNEKELLLAIPYFAKKLKDISLYYLQLRTAIKESRLRYNQTGANVGIIEQIQKFILTNYTKKPNTSISLPGSIWKDVPELSSVKDNIAIQIEELYDAQNYFDRSPTLPPSAYYITDSKELERFLTTKGLTLTSTEWIYRLGVNTLSADYTDIVGSDLIELSEKISQKYLGDDKFISFNSNLSTEKQFFEIEIDTGNNFLYWPEGVYRSRAKEQQRFQPVSLNESGLNTVATPGSSLELADTVFVKTTRGVEGAWFRNNLYDFKTVNMEAVLNFNDKTTFRYPFPGYGLSAEDIEWTGFNSKFNPTFFFLEESIQQQIEKEYWSTQIELSTTIPLSINDTTLIDSKAYSDFSFDKADKIRVWFDTPEYDVPVYNSEEKSAWLYRFNNTDISINNGENVIVWPFEKIDPEEDYPTYYPKKISDTCLPIPISTLNIPYSIAGDALSSSDVIYKLNNYQDPIEDAIEACWLSGNTLQISDQNLLISQQNSFQLLINSGEFTKFVWLGEDNIDAETVFKSFSHRSDCKFKNIPEGSYLDFEQCNCKQVNFTPFGHPGENYTDNRSFCDFIIEDNFTPNSLDLSEWRDSNNNNYNTSSSFAWYRTTDKIGWGNGRWVSGDSLNDNKLFLQNGKKYIYYRAKTPTLDASDIILPSYVVRYFDNNFNVPGIWLRAFKNENNEWVATKEPSQMVLTPGDTLLYNRANTTNFFLTGSDTELQYVLENRNSIWSSSDYLTINDGTSEGLSQNIVISFPTVTTLTTTTNTQYPKLNINNLVSVLRWEIEHDQTQTKYIFTDTPVVTFTPNLTGTYSIQVTALSATSLIPIDQTTTSTSVKTTAGTNFSRTNNVVTVSFTNHGYTNGDIIAFTNNGQAALNGVYTIIVVNANQFQYITPTSGNLTGSGTVTLTRTITNTIQTFPNTGLYIFQQIPQITAVSPIVAVPTLTSFEIPVAGFVWNIPLKGWDYNQFKENPNAINSGGRPFWAKIYTEKNDTTNSRGIPSWGTPYRVVDEFNILTQPEISDIFLTIGNKVEYTRNLPIDLTWIQPIDFQVLIDENNWCTLLFETTGISNLAYQLNNYKNELVVTPTLCTSNLQFLNLVDNEPVEVYYNAINPFTWSITAVPEIEKTVFTDISASLAIKTNQPWANLSNQFYPSIAAFPSIDKLYSSIDSGGFFNPSNLGINVYTDNDFTATLDISSNVLTRYFENINKKVQGRGFSKQDQPSPYIDITDNNIWLKEPTVAGPIAGTIKKSIFKKYQKFLPYQSGYETNPRLQVGMLTPKSRQSPWGGKEDSEWTDLANFPQSPTGEINVQAWADSQILKQSGLQVDNWCTDIFGNQYALYKQLSGTTPFNRKFIPGEIWVRKNSQFTAPASIALKEVFDTYENTNLLKELTGQGIRKIDLFFDTLLIETSGTVIFEKLNYNYNTDTIFSLTDEARYLSLSMPVSLNLNKEFANTNLSNFTFAQAGETWFFPNEKIVTQSVCGIQNSILFPELYRFDLNSLTLKKIFPILTEDITTIQQLSSLNIISIDPPTLSHNSIRKEYLLTVLGRNNLNRPVIIEFLIKDLPTLSLNKATVYEPLPRTLQLNPPFISQELFTDLAIDNFNFENALNFQCFAQNGPVVFEPVSMPSWVNLSRNGLFTGTPPLQTTSYDALFKVTNSVGPVFYSLLINVVYTQITEFTFLFTEGYEQFAGEGLGIFEDDGFIVQEEHDLGVGVISRIIE